MDFRVLGSVEAFVGGRAIDLGPARQRCVLAVLLVEINQVVPGVELVDRVWGNRPPLRARGTLYSYLSRLRSGLSGAADVVISRRSGGYVLNADPAVADLHRFHELVARARQAESNERAAGLYEQALSLWRGEALATMDTPWANQLRVTLEAERRAATLDHVDVRLALGRHTDLLAELEQRVAEHPVDERLAGQLMVALHRSGRSADALDAYQRIRRWLADELGTDPAPPLQDLHHQILTVDDAVAAPSMLVKRPVPRQLPHGVGHFIGRHEELAKLDKLLRTEHEDREAAAVITGMPGVGKSTLALRWAGLARDQLPDGDLYVNLRGFDPTGNPAGPADVLAGFLRALGTSDDVIPDALEERAALFRSVVSGRRMLIVLDNARNTEQVRPLLPGTPSCLVVVTSRDQLAGLVARDGAGRLALEPLPPTDAEALLRRVVGRELGPGSDAAHELARRCGFLPLALRIAAEYLAARPRASLAAVVAELSDRNSPLDTLAAGDDELTAIRSVLSWSYRVLPPDSARLFRLLGAHPGPTITPAAAAALAHSSSAVAGKLLDTLFSNHLVIEVGPGRYQLHDLIRAYMIELARHDPERPAAIERLLDYYLETAYEAYLHLEEHREWYESEQLNFLAAVHCAVHNGLFVHAWQLAYFTWHLYDRYNHRRSRHGTEAAALAATRRLGDRWAERLVLDYLERVYGDVELPAERTRSDAAPPPATVLPSPAGLPPMDPQQRAQVLVGLARNPVVPLDVVHRLLPLPGAGRLAAQRADIGDELAAALLGLHDSTIYSWLAGNPRVPRWVWQRLAADADPSVRRSLILSVAPRWYLYPTWLRPSIELPIELRTQLAADPNSSVRRSMASIWTDAPEPVRRAWLTDQSRAVRKAALGPGHPAPPEDLIASLLADPETRRDVIFRLPLTPAVIEELATDASPSIRERIAAHPDLPTSWRDRLADDSEPLVRVAVLCRQDCPEHVRARLFTDLVGGPEDDADLAMIGLRLEPIRWLSDAPLAIRLAYLDSPYDFFRRAVASSEGLPAYAVARLLTDPDPEIQRRAATRAANAPGPELERLVREHNGDWASPKTGPSLTDHPNFPQEAFHRFAVDPDQRIRALACKGRDLPSALVARLAADPSPGIRRQAAEHPHLPVECLAALLVDEDLDVVEAAATSPVFPALWVTQLVNEAGL